MVKGLSKFKEHFSNHKDKFVLIGGTACDIAMAKIGEDFRTTKDLDIVLLIESIDKEFGNVFWDFIKEGKYKYKQKSSGKKIFYRFYDPEQDEYPFMLELFARSNELLPTNTNIHLTRISIDDQVSSLSAILLDDNYYKFILQNRNEEDGVPIVTPAGIIPLKAKAYLDLTERKNKGETIDSNKIKKHKNDIFRMFNLLTPETKISLLPGMILDMNSFIDAIRDQRIDLDNLIGSTITLQEIIDEIENIYMLK